jgi:hypothetical protein
MSTLVALLYDGNKLSPTGMRFTAWLENKICNAEESLKAHAEDGLEVPSDELVEAEAELARLYAVKDALTNLPVRIMLVNVLVGIQSNDQRDTKDEEDIESLQALIRADIALINECLR